MKSLANRLPRWACDILATPPPSGEGFHGWLFRAARALWKCGRTETDIQAYLENAAITCGRRVTAREIVDAVRNSRPGALQLGKLQQKLWPSINAEQREAIIDGDFGLVDLWEMSPIRFDDNTPHTEQVIDRLFPGNPLLCVGSAVYDSQTALRDEWRGRLASLPLLVPNPMTALTGWNQNGELSRRCLNNTDARRFLIVEFDTGTIDEHAALIFHLANSVPLALALFSGSKSLHSWFYCAEQPEEKVLRFFRYAVSLGADRATWPRCQLVRMPDAQRDNSNRQAVYFFNPDVIR